MMVPIDDGSLVERLRMEAIQQADTEWAALVEEAADEIERWRAALTLACRDGWSDPQATMEHYLTIANDWLIDTPLSGRPSFRTCCPTNVDEPHQDVCPESPLYGRTDDPLADARARLVERNQAARSGRTLPDEGGERA